MNNVTWAMLGLPTTAIPRKRRQRARVPSAPPVLAPLSLLGPGLDLDADNNVLNDTPRVPSVAPPPIPHRSHSNPIPRSLIKKLSLSSSPTSSSSFSLWSRRRTQPTQPPPPLLPLVRVTSPFTVDMPIPPPRPKSTLDSSPPSPTETLSSFPHSPLQRRRCTLAMAMTDDDITDEILVQHLERIRLRKNDLDQFDHIWDLNYVLSRIFESTSPRHPHLPSSLPDSTSTHQWHTARRLLLTCRELVRTEHHYLLSLQALLSSQTLGSPPPLMLSYVDQLVSVSQSYLASMVSDPSSCGVATAFLNVEQAMDTAFVRWCSVVALWFDNHSPSSNDLDQDDLVHVVHEDVVLSTASRLKINSWRRSLASLTDLATNTPNPKKKDKAWLLLHSPAKPKMPSIRDMAILPTQRIMRYVLLYRALLTHTPSISPSHGLVQRAVDAALRIAQKCDRAQTHSAFMVNTTTTTTKFPKPTVVTTAPAFQDLSVSA